MPTLNDLRECLTKKSIDFEINTSDRGFFSLKVSDLSGKRKLFSLEVVQDGESLKVREINNQFPDFCPNRHINRNGYFCLGLDEDLKELSIDEWFVIVKDFLKAQLIVEKRRSWPKAFKEWSHGHAAIYQRKVEEILGGLNISSLGMSIDKLSIVEKESKAFPKESFFHLYHESDLILTSFEDRVHNKRQSCICEKYGIRMHKTMGQCPNNCAKKLFDIAFFERKRILEEEKLWKVIKGHDDIKCCNTLNNCGLK